MRPEQSDVSKHYAHGNLTQAIRPGLGSPGKSTDTVTIADLAPVDEFAHWGPQNLVQVGGSISQRSVLAMPFTAGSFDGAYSYTSG